MASTPAAALPSSPPAKKPRRWRRYLRLALITYLLVVLMLSLFQSWLIFPGRSLTHGDSARLYQPQGSQLLTLTLADGSQAAALFIPARHNRVPATNTRQHPTIIHFYGNAQCMAWALDEAELFRSCGFNVLMGDYPGFGLSPGSPSETGCYALADALWNWARTSEQVDSARIVVSGWSLGSGVAVDLASRRPAAALLTFSAYTSLAEIARRQFPLLPTSWFLQHPFQSLEKMPQVTCPVLLFHGRSDSIIPPDMLPRLAAATRRPSQSILINSDHNDLFQLGWDEIARELGRLREALTPQ